LEPAIDKPSTATLELEPAVDKYIDPGNSGCDIGHDLRIAIEAANLSDLLDIDNIAESDRFNSNYKFGYSNPNN
jgi:hypothetical protein